MQISKSVIKLKPLSWREENGSYVITAYFKDPSLICSQKPSHAKYIGDRLLIQISAAPHEFVQVPLLENGLLRRAWTEGECFWSMGELKRHCYTCSIVTKDYVIALKLFTVVCDHE